MCDKTKMATWKTTSNTNGPCTFRTGEAKFIPNFYQVEDLGKKWVGRETTGFPLSNMAVTIAVYGHNFPRTCLLYFALVIVVNCDSHKSTKRSNFSITPITNR